MLHLSGSIQKVGDTYRRSFVWARAFRGAIMLYDYSKFSIVTWFVENNDSGPDYGIYNAQISRKSLLLFWSILLQFQTLAKMSRRERKILVAPDGHKYNFIVADRRHWNGTSSSSSLNNRNRSGHLSRMILREYQGSMRFSGRRRTRRNGPSSALSRSISSRWCVTPRSRRLLPCFHGVVVPSSCSRRSPRGQPPRGRRHSSTARWGQT